MKNEGRNNSANRVQTMVVLAILIAIVVVLQALGAVVRIGPFSMTFVLIPVVVGAILYGPYAGAVLGAAFGIVVTINSVSGVDLGGFAMWNVRPALTVVICLAKGILAGCASGLVYRCFREKQFAATLAAAVVCPLVNTGIFLLFLTTCYKDVLSSWAGDQSAAYYVLVGIVVANFLPEVLLNVLLSPSIVRIVRVRKKN